MGRDITLWDVVTALGGSAPMLVIADLGGVVETVLLDGDEKRGWKVHRTRWLKESLVCRTIVPEDPISVAVRKPISNYLKDSARRFEAGGIYPDGFNPELESKPSE